MSTSLCESQRTVIDHFDGEFRWLSNFWPARVILDFAEYPSIEHAYVAAKTLDPEIRAQVQVTRKPGQVKRLGRTIKLRKDWDEIKLSVMEDLVRQKFSQSVLKEMLLATLDAELVEGNYWNDTFWGVCKGVGENHLGKLLMKIREELKGDEEI